MPSVDLLGPASATNATATRPTDTRVFGDTDTWFKPCSVPGVQDGTQLQAVWFNGILAQIRRAIKGMGITVNNADDDMLLKAIQAQGIPYLIDTGAANVMVVTSVSAITSYSVGAIFVKAGNDVTGATTINRDAIGAKNVVHPDGSALARGEWPKDAIGLLFYDGAKFQLLSVFYSQHGQQFGQCELTLSGGNLVLSRKNGRFILVGGSFREIPVGGVLLSPSAMTVGQFYYVYAKSVAGALALDKSTTGYAADASTGQAVKSDDPTWSLVGACYVVAGPAFSDTDGARYVLSWFNRKAKRSRTAFTAAHSTASNNIFVEIGAEIRNGFIAWSDEPVGFMACGAARSSGGQNVVTAIAFDGVIAEPERCGGGSGVQGAWNFSPVSLAGRKAGLSEAAAHYATLVGYVTSGAGSAAWPGEFDAPPDGALFATTLTIEIKG